MKKTLALIALFALVGNFAFTPKPAALTWETDYQAAVKKAKKENKKLLLNFTGSDWCGWCKKLDREVFTQKDFIDYADKNLVCVKLDFPRSFSVSAAEKAQNYKLAQQHSVRGYPTILVVNTAEKVLLRTGYKPGGPQGYIDHLKPYVNPSN